MSSRKQGVDKDQVLVRPSGNPNAAHGRKAGRAVSDPNGLNDLFMKHLLQIGS
jgi:hypothetical protein